MFKKKAKKEEIECEYNYILIQIDADVYLLSKGSILLGFFLPCHFKFLCTIVF